MLCQTPHRYGLAVFVKGSGVAEDGDLQSCVMRLEILIRSECQDIRHPSQEVQEFAHNVPLLLLCSATL